jgi:HD-GYP domain-containing protein (c-di-GMP phosphodiesterase class II)
VAKGKAGGFPPLFLLLSNGTEPDQIVRSLERGADDYLEFSHCRQLLLPKVRSLLSVQRWQRDLREEETRLSQANGLLERNFKEMTAILLKILEIRIPGASDRAEMAKTMAEFIAHNLLLDDESRRQVIFAALLHEMGKVGLPDDLVCRTYCNLPAALVPVYQQYTTVGSIIVSTISGFRESAEAIYHQLENYDGSGFPGELMGEEIPIGARILRGMVLAEDLRGQGLSIESTVEQIRLSMHVILDQRIANLLIGFLLDESTRPDTGKVKVPVDKLTAGMVIAEDIHAASGVKLLPKGVQLQEKMLALLLERHATDPILGGVYVLMDHQEEEA